MDNYKITNKNEEHYGLQYHDGLNIDPVPFNPSGNCEPGGIYYANKDILAFLSYGCWLRKVTIPDDAQVYENPGTPKKYKADKVILGERIKITLDVIEGLISEGADAKNKEVFRSACEYGCTDIVKILIKYGANAKNEAAFEWACEYGCTDIVEILKKYNK